MKKTLLTDAFVFMAILVGICSYILTDKPQKSNLSPNNTVSVQSILHNLHKNLKKRTVSWKTEEAKFQ